MLCLVCALCFDQDKPPSESLFSKQILTSKDWAEVANAYIAMGEKQMAVEVEDWKKSEPSFSRPGRFRRGLLCRLLFTSKDKCILQAPGFGGLFLPYKSMPDSKWPDYPMVQESGVWFLLSEGYYGGGFGFWPDWYYFDYCQKNGRFRTHPLKVPTKTEAAQALARLLESERWKLITWADKAAYADTNAPGELQHTPESSILNDLKAQTEF